MAGPQLGYRSLRHVRGTPGHDFYIGQTGNGQGCQVLMIGRKDPTAKGFSFSIPFRDEASGAIFVDCYIAGLVGIQKLALGLGVPLPTLAIDRVTRHAAIDVAEAISEARGASSEERTPGVLIRESFDRYLDRNEIGKTADPGGAPGRFSLGPPLAGMTVDFDGAEASWILTTEKGKTVQGGFGDSPLIGEPLRQALQAALYLTKKTISPEIYYLEARRYAAESQPQCENVVTAATRAVGEARDLLDHGMKPCRGGPVVPLWPRP